MTLMLPKKVNLFCISFFLLCAPPVVLASWQDSSSPKGPQPQASTSPQGLLIQSYLSSLQLTPEERSMALMYLAFSAARIEPSYNRLWSEELFYSAFQLPRDWNRLAYEKNALEALSESDPILAFELFGEMDDPIPTQSGTFPEDVRAFAARKVFSAYWKRKGAAGLDKIQAQAQHLGTTGQYPYVAMIPIILELSHVSDSRSQALFNDAVNFFSRGSSFDSAKPDFVELLNGVWDTLPAPLKHQALDVAVRQLTQKTSQNTDSLFTGKSLTKSSEIEFTDPDSQLLFALLPRVKEVDPEWAKRLANQNPSLAAGIGSETVKRTDAVTLHGVSSATPAQLAAAQFQLSQRRILSQVNEIASQDPDAALAKSQALTDQELRASALASIAVGLAEKQPQRASKLLSEAESLAAQEKDNPGKVKVLFAIARGYLAVKDQKAMQAHWNRAFDLGQELFQEDSEAHPGRLAYQTACFESLRSLTEFAAKLAPPMMLQAMRGVRNQLLRTYLGISVADGMFEHEKDAS